MSQYGALPKAAAVALPLTLGTWSIQAADLVETAGQHGQFYGFLQLVEAAGMVETLRGEGPFTLFAPTDEALSQLPAGMLDQLLAAENRKSLEAVIHSHIVADAAILTRDLLGQAVEVATLGGGTLAIDGTTGIIALAPIEPSVTDVDGQTVVEPANVATPVSVMVKTPQTAVRDANRSATPGEQELMGVATVIEPDIGADNGVIHGIDLVLVPSSVLWSF